MVAVVDAGPEQMIRGRGSLAGVTAAERQSEGGGETQRRGQQRQARSSGHPRTKVGEARGQSTGERIEQQWVVDGEVPPDGVVSCGSPSAPSVVEERSPMSNGEWEVFTAANLGEAGDGRGE